MLTTFAILIVLSIALIVYAFWPKGNEEDQTVKRRIRGRSNRPGKEGPTARQQAKASVAKRMMQRVAPIAMRPAMIKNPEEISKLRLKLANAGYRGDNAPTSFLASKSICAVGFALIALAYSLMKGDGFTGAAGMAVFGLALGFLAPNLWLSSAVGKRKGLVLNALPDTLDLMVISVESGLGLDAAIQRVSDEMRRVHPELSEELTIVTLESQMGIPRAEALMHLVDRTGLDEVRSLAAVINQAERFGTSISRALRNQSDALRTKRRQRAEERAASTTVKLMAPLILFIFPAILVVLAGPAALKMIDALSNTPGLL